MAEVKPAYLISGTDEAKIGETRGRLRERAEREGGAGALEVFAAGEGRAAPDAEAFIAALPAMSLAASRRYVLADGVERWGGADAAKVAAALEVLPPDTTVVLIAAGKAPAALAKAVKGCGGELLAYDAPRERDLPRRLVADAKDRGFRLDADAARLLVERMGTGGLRLANELDRLAMWAGDGGQVGVADLEAMVTDTSETVLWTLSDALIEGDAARSMAIAERLSAQGEVLPRLVYGLASRLRNAQHAVAGLEAGRPPKDVVSSLDMHPYAAKMLLSRLRDTSSQELRASTVALADLEVASRGGSAGPGLAGRPYDEAVAFTMCLRRALGAAA